MHPTEGAQRWAWLASHVDGLRRALRSGPDAREADDLAQEAILRASQSATALPPGPQGAAWLRRIARNIAIDRWRRERRLAPLDTARHLTAGPDAWDGRIDVESALRRLRPADRRLLTLIAGGARYGELAASEGVAVSVIRQRVARARARALAILREE